MISKINSIFFKPSGLEKIVTLKHSEIEFILMHKNIIIATLHLSNGEWTFIYSETFKSQNKITPLIDFPDKHKIYKHNELWPFFLSRIPGLGQPEIQHILEKENINKNDEAALLKRFGYRTISNPFILKPSIC